MVDFLDLERKPSAPRSFSQPFWDATRERRFLLQYDKRAERFQFFPRAAALSDGARDLDWREASGRGTVFSHTIARRSRGPFNDATPFTIALITLEEGVNVMANLVGCAPEDVAIGMAVTLDWCPLPDGTHLPIFKPATD
ncbi:OB-fold domain-containing protein [Marivita sp. S6314]|uniref:Zn-ribbon domain-containing OB-fold protein n=1 Tax=Marivita sp. S6314 TaxID=2926406 RepID=UPI001FF36E2B|nr:OB-fold domain-containing protein [Marivita sp. S6314]MCK0150877.1 OB-fold domain-containing protein [Marivita sp. S6314]